MLYGGRARVMRLAFLSVAAVVITGCGRGDDRRTGAPTDTVAAANAAPVSSATNTPRSAASNAYVGAEYDSLPRGVSYKGGSVAGNYDFARVGTASGDMIWLDSIVGPSGRPPRKLVKASLSVPPLRSDERLVLASCDVNGKLDPLVVAIVVNEPSVTRYTKVRQAWRANVEAARFDVIPIDGIVCEEA